MLAAGNLLQLEAGMQPCAQHRTLLVGKELLLGPLRPQRGDQLEGVYGGRVVFHFPEYLPLMFTICCAMLVFVS